jgi:nitrogen regulatory protein PII
MKTYKVEFEIVLKNDDINWLWDTIEQQLETGEFLDSQLIEEVTDEQTN